MIQILFMLLDQGQLDDVMSSFFLTCRFEQGAPDNPLLAVH